MTTREELRRHVRSWNRADQIELWSIRIVLIVAIASLVYEAVRRMS